MNAEAIVEKILAALLVVFAIALLLIATGCGATTCKQLTIERHPYPDYPAGRCYVFKCGEKSTEACVRSPPKCWDDCWTPAAPELVTSPPPQMEGCCYAPE